MLRTTTQSPVHQAIESFGKHWHEARNGERGRGVLVVGETATGQPLGIPYRFVKGARAGPVLWVNGAVHGDELNGVLGAIDFFSSLDPEAMSGSVILTPASNFPAFDARSKTGGFDGLDLDQQFPGRADGLLSMRIANALFEAITPIADYVLNLHTHGTQFASLPYGVYKVHPGSPVSEAALRSLVSCFGAAFVCRMPVENAGGELPGNIAGALDFQSLAAGKPAFMMEMGGGGREEPRHVEATRKGLLSLARLAGILAEDPQAPLPAPSDSIRLVTQRQHVFADRGGLFRTTANPGDMIPAGTIIGVIHDVGGEILQEVVLDHDCIIIGIRYNPVIHAGDRVCFIGRSWEEAKIDPGEMRRHLVDRAR